MKINRRKIIYLIILILIVLLVIAAVNRVSQKRQEVTTAPQNQMVRIVPVEVSRVQRGEIKSFLSVSGLIEPKEIVRVFAKTVGQVKEILVEEGTKVNKGDILARLDDEQIRLQVAQARANLDAAQASLAKIKAGARPQEISQAEAAVRQAEINLKSLEENYQRMQKLFSEGAVSEQQYIQAKNQFEIAQAQYQAAYESYKLVTEGASPEDIRAVEAQVRQAQSALELAQSQMNNTIIKAPIDGIVTALSIKTGEIVSQALPLLSIMDNSELYIKTGVSEKDIATVQVGQKAEIYIDAFPGEKFKGELVHKGVLVDPVSKTMEIKIKILEPHLEIPPGVFARADILIAHRSDTLIIPSLALTRKTEGLYVFVLGEGKNTVQKRSVVIGLTEGNKVEVISGLEENEIIVISGNITLEEKDQVRVINPEVIE